MPDASLDIVGQIKIRGGSPGAGNILTSDANGLASWAPFAGDADWTLGVGAIYNLTDKVGIGIATPGQKLQIHEATASAPVYAAWTSAVAPSGGLVGIDSAGQMVVRNNEATSLVFLTNGIERGRFSATGYFGIGTASPGSPLTVIGVSELIGTVYAQPSGTSNGQTVLGLSGSASAILQYNASGGVNNALLANGDSYITGGYLGVGITTPQRGLHVHTGTSSGAYALFTNSTTGTTLNDGFLIGIDSDESAVIWQYESNVIRFGTTALERMRITSTGLVGIGETSPSIRLQVNSGATNTVAYFKSTDDLARIQVADDDTEATFLAQNGVAAIWDRITHGLHDHLGFWQCWYRHDLYRPSAPGTRNIVSRLYRALYEHDDRADYV